MCLSVDEVNPLCDECFVRDKEGLIETEADLCSSCQGIASRVCWCCFLEYDSAEDAQIMGGLCWRCRGET
jgi:hypothetical protein